MPKKSKKLSPEEKKFQQYTQEMQPVFRLFDGDADGKLTPNELQYFLAAVALPMENEEIEQQFKVYQDYDLQQAVQIAMEIERVSDEGFRVKHELYSMFHTEDVQKTPIMDRKTLYQLLQAGPNALPTEYLGYMHQTMEDKGRNKVPVMMQEKHMKELGCTQEQIDAANKQIKDNEANLIDLRYLIIHMYQYLSTGQIMIKELMDQKKKEKAAAKEKAKKK
ncbi:EF-hand_domain pair-containing protein [Hexamita inflata]|uniref:EF-hand domain pair-containing protein n=1 Tax=Hexamita inflata TaxID=28002 RepID=A0AA86P953_9EUKA|nr:EF-hand domain pair-containing protein [Hexamita inflata]CAI9931802.1 EF-hand domain pair-containing protein [Hexamita inflata]CAI9933444.1 EF-hand domain pair-containing protein [Hexamita inflata]CAI9958608.1 EF-hand domain pair-containing protein [Hexamita inflata]